MARAKVVHSKDACSIIFKGNKNSPEPTTGTIKFPGGEVEVSRTSNGEYWAHIKVDKPANVVNSRVDYDFEGYTKAEVKIPKIPHHENIEHYALLVNGPYVSTEML